MNMKVYFLLILELLNFHFTSLLLIIIFQISYKFSGINISKEIWRSLNMQNLTN